MRWGEKSETIDQERRWKKLYKEDYSQEDILFLKELEKLIKEHRLPLLPQEDTTAWDLTPSGNFTVKSTYTFRFSKDPCPTLWLKVWITDLIPKINFFWQTAQHGKISTLDNLKRRVFYITNHCCLCKEKEESISHLFLDCQYALGIWAKVWERFGSDQVMNDNLGQFVENWCCPFYHPRLVFLWKNFPPYVCQHIWKERNNRLFREEINQRMWFLE